MSAPRAAVAARVSQLTDGSLSIRRQVKSGEAYALARLWPVVAFGNSPATCQTLTTPTTLPTPPPSAQLRPDEGLRRHAGRCRRHGPGRGDRAGRRYCDRFGDHLVHRRSVRTAHAAVAHEVGHRLVTRCSGTRSHGAQGHGDTRCSVTQCSVTRCSVTRPPSARVGVPEPKPRLARFYDGPERAPASAGLAPADDTRR